MLLYTHTHTHTNTNVYAHYTASNISSEDWPLNIEMPYSVDVSITRQTPFCIIACEKEDTNPWYGPRTGLCATGTFLLLLRPKTGFWKNILALWIPAWLRDSCSYR